MRVETKSHPSPKTPQIPANNAKNRGKPAPQLKLRQIIAICESEEFSTSPMAPQLKKSRLPAIANSAGACNLIERLERRRHDSNQMTFDVATFFARAGNIFRKCG
jgi:hypothetical protein